MLTTHYKSTYAHDLAALYAEAGWGDFHENEDELQLRYTNSTFSAYFVVEDKVVGCIRVLSDRISVTWIAEILVANAFRRQGIGKKLVELVLDEFQHTDIFLETFGHAAEFFEKCGLNTRKSMVVCSKKHSIRS